MNDLSKLNFNDLISEIKDRKIEISKMIGHEKEKNIKELKVLENRLNFFSNELDFLKKEICSFKNKLEKNEDTNTVDYKNDIKDEVQKQEEYINQMKSYILISRYLLDKKVKKQKIVYQVKGLFGNHICYEDFHLLLVFSVLSYYGFLGYFLTINIGMLNMFMFHILFLTISGILFYLICKKEKKLMEKQLYDSLKEINCLDKKFKLKNFCSYTEKFNNLNMVVENYEFNVNDLKDNKKRNYIIKQLLRMYN